MYRLSERCLTYLCTALYALPKWWELLESYGLVELAKYPRYDYPDVDNPEVPHQLTPSWHELKAELDSAKRKAPEQLLDLCSELLRRRNEDDWFHVAGADRTKFRDAVTGLEEALKVEGYNFNGFAIRRGKPSTEDGQTVSSKDIGSHGLALTRGGGVQEPMGNRTDWEQIDLLGEGGQSQVFKVRRPPRVQERFACIREIAECNPWAPMLSSTDRPHAGRLAEALWKYARPDAPSELGAMKVFNKLREASPEAEREAVERLKREIAVLRQKRPGLPQLLDSNEPERWIVTEFFAKGTLEDHPVRYRGQTVLALRAFRCLVETAASFHKEGIIHRDIKPANIFVREDDQLVLGDFGIVYVPNQEDRVTRTNERVGPRDYMPQWGDLGARLENVKPNFDVYMLGKVLWCMVAGRLRLPREYHKRPEFNLTDMFPSRPEMYSINSILDQCVVEEPDDCLQSAQKLLPVVDEHLGVLDRGGQLLSDGVPRPCRVCGKGSYRPWVPRETKSDEIKLRLWTGPSSSETVMVSLRLFTCDVCGHVELFK